MKKASNKDVSSPVYNAFQDSESILKRFLTRFFSCKHDIEDVCQETILRALEAEKSRNIEDPKAFLFGVSKNIVRKQLEKKSKSLIDFIEDFTPPEYVSDEAPSLHNVFEDQLKMRVFSEAVATLPRQCQQVFVLKKVYGYSHKEIASKLSISISTTEKHVATGLQRCSAYMHKKLDSDNLYNQNDKTLTQAISNANE